ncbi:MAG TPA: mechanosensitive ion channel family protein [Thermodesulfobacteriota bacterium]|nr:mechanosensitive ion channel family protein [Thermodesulfobacteriota bacterium]
MTAFGYELPAPVWIVVPAYLALIVLASRLASAGIEWALRRWARRTRGTADDRFVKAIRAPLVFALFLGGLRLGLLAVELAPRARATVEQIIQLGLIALLALAGVRLLGLVVAEWGRRVEGVGAIAGPAQAMGKVILIAVALVMMADALGISIAPLVTTLGLGSLAVALALQDTLANFFSGLYLLADKPVRVGDYIRLDTGEEGYVTSIGWRSTRIRQLSNNIVVVPNQKLSQAIITNYHLPEPRMALLIRVGVAYDADPDRVERLLLEVAADAARSGEIPGLLAEPAPLVRFIPGFGDSSLDFTLIVQVAEFVDQYVVQHELRKRILAALRRAGIEIPYPHRTVEVREFPWPRSASTPPPPSLS